jgi:hypothetical protein
VAAEEGQGQRATEGQPGQVRALQAEALDETGQQSA